MREGGVEPPRPFGHTDLNRARLPIPPLAPEAGSGYPSAEDAPKPVMPFAGRAGGAPERPLAGRARRAPASRCRDPRVRKRWSRHARPWPASRLDHRKTGAPRPCALPFAGRARRAPASRCRDPRARSDGLDTLGRGRPPGSTTERQERRDPVPFHSLVEPGERQRAGVETPEYASDGLDTLGRGRPPGSTTERQERRDPVPFHSLVEPGERQRAGVETPRVRKRWSRHARPWPASRLDHRKTGAPRPCALPFAGRARRAPASRCRDPRVRKRWSRHARPWPASRLDHREDERLPARPPRRRARLPARPPRTGARLPARRREGGVPGRECRSRYDR